MMNNSRMKKWVRNHRSVLAATLLCSILYGIIFAAVMNMHDGHIDNPFNPDTYEFIHPQLPSLPVVNPDKIVVPDSDVIHIGDMLDGVSVPDDMFEIKFSRVVDETYDGVARRADLGLDKYIAVTVTMKYIGEKDGMFGEYIPLMTVFDEESSAFCNVIIREDNEWEELDTEIRSTYNFEPGKTYDVIFYCDRSKFMSNIGIYFFSTSRQFTSLNVVRGE